MNRKTREIQSFFYSQYFSDGLRITLGILLPSLILAQVNQLETGLTLSLGALCVSGADNPGPVNHKRNGMLTGSLLMFVVAVVTGFARLNIITMGIEIVVFSFIFSMFTVYGNRAASVGMACLLIMILMMEKALLPSQILTYSAIILAGSLWYTLLSVTFFSIRPYRAAQQALGENMLDVAKFLRLKAEFYKPETNMDDNYQKVVSQQIHVSQNQDAVRELLFKSRLVVKESTNASRILVLTFIDLVDLFEQIMATHYDYAAIHQRFESTGVLDDIAQTVSALADELDDLGFAILANAKYKHTADSNSRLEKLHTHIDSIAAEDHEAGNLVLKKILINLRNVNQTIVNISDYYNSRSAAALDNRGVVEYSRFVSHQEYDPQVYLDNLTLSSSTFKHAIRVSLVCLFGYIMAKTIANGHHSYWILLTIIVILKPGFSLTKQRNYQRLMGTIAGGAIGILVLYFVSDVTAQLIILMVFMVAAYSFQRLNYIISVIFMTPYILILFKFLGVGHVVEERITDTIIGSVTAFIASYVIFPTWEFDLIKGALNDVIKANIKYMMTVAQSLSGMTVNTTEYKLARKDVYVYSANLSAAFERMTSEPKRQQKHVKDVHRFVVLNHILTSYIANIASTMLTVQQPKVQPDNLKLVKRSVSILFDTSKKITNMEAGPPHLAIPPINTIPPKTGPTQDEQLLKEQLEFVVKVSNDIAKVTGDVLA